MRVAGEHIGYRAAALIFEVETFRRFRFPYRTGW